jgi:hypothetical protein
MILAVEVDQLAHMTATTAYEVWQDLKRVHRSCGFTTKMALCRKFMSMQMDDNQKMASWIGEVRGVAFCLKQAGITVDNEDVILVLTMGLPDSYNTFIVTLNSTDSSTLTLNYIIKQLLNEESRKTPTSTCEAAFRTDANHLHPRCPVSEIICFNCQKKGHYQSDCPDKKSSAATANDRFDASW